MSRSPFTLYRIYELVHVANIEGFYHKHKDIAFTKDTSLSWASTWVKTERLTNILSHGHLSALRIPLRDLRATGYHRLVYDNYKECSSEAGARRKAVSRTDKCLLPTCHWHKYMPSTIRASECLLRLFVRTDICHVHCVV